MTMAAMLRKEEPSRRSAAVAAEGLLFLKTWARTTRSPRLVLFSLALLCLSPLQLVTGEVGATAGAATMSGAVGVRAATSDELRRVEARLAADRMREEGKSNTAAGVAAAAPARKKRKTRNEMKEESLIESLMNCPLCKGKEAVACFKFNRYELKKTWRQTLDICIENHFLRSTFLYMLPSEETETPQPQLTAAEQENATTGEAEQQQQPPAGKIGDSGTHGAEL